MDFLTQQEVSGIRQDIRHGEAKQFAEKNEFERKLLGELGEEMEKELENPNTKRNKEFAKKYTKKKKRRVWKENLTRIFGGQKKEAI
jgi:hypothetical protein